MDGALTDETDDDSLCHDMACVLLRYTSDRPNGGLIGRRLSEKDARALAEELASELAPMTGGRYLPRMRDSKRRKRNEQMVAFFNGKNYAECMEKFGMSRRLVFSVLAEYRNRKVVQSR